MNTVSIAQRMRKMIGDHFHYLDQNWVLIEVLEQEDNLILVALNSHAPIQADQYGQATRRVPETLTLQISDPEGEGYSEDILVLLEGRLTD